MTHEHEALRKLCEYQKSMDSDYIDCIEVNSLLALLGELDELKAVKQFIREDISISDLYRKIRSLEDSRASKTRELKKAIADRNHWKTRAEAAEAELARYKQAEADGLLVVLPIKPYQTVYYILDGVVYVGWYLAKPAEHTHIVLQDKVEMGICWVSDSHLFLTHEAAEAALEGTRK